MTIDEFVSQLEREWDLDGFLGTLRRGSFSSESGDRFVELLSQCPIAGSATVPARLLSLIWYVSPFLIWQRARVEKERGDTEAFDRFVTEVQNMLEKVVGVP